MAGTRLMSCSRSILKPEVFIHTRRASAKNLQRPVLCNTRDGHQEESAARSTVLGQSAFTGAHTLAQFRCQETKHVDSASHFQKNRPPGICCAKAKAKKKPAASKPKLKPWPFEDLMMFWDVAFERWCEDAERRKLIVDTAAKGLAAYGRGAVLIRETVKSRSVKVAGSGFGSEAKRVRPPDDEQQFDSLSYAVEYVPRWKLERPSDVQPDGEVPSDAPTLVAYEDLRPLLRSMDCYRILSLTGSDQGSTSTTATTEDGNELQVDVLSSGEPSQTEELGFEVANEEPYNSDRGELVLLMAVTVDGQLAVGADVLQRVPSTTEDDSAWKLVTREELFL